MKIKEWVIVCDTANCRQELPTDATTKRDARRIAKKNKWLIVGTLDFCPECAALMRS